mgnify:CR=1 FL=1
MNQNVVAFTGISGVGKTTFLRNLAESVRFQHLTGGSLIATARETGHDQRDAMRYADLDENQLLLIDGFAVVRDPAEDLVVMDGHVAIDDGNSLQKLPAQVFRALGVTMMIHLGAEPMRISANRSNDMSRSRPTYGLEILTKHQDISRLHAQSIAAELGVEFQSVTHDDVAQLASVLKS